MNCDGFKEKGITFPSVEKQKILLNKFYEECEIMPSELSYMEAHATGTVAGDPVEVMSIDQTLCAKRNTPLLMGSVNLNLGHSEPASGLCQIAKVLLAMEIGTILPTIYFKRPRKELTAIIEGRIKFVTEPTEWEGGYIGVNSFGFGGANSHILLKSNLKQKINNGAPNDDLPRLVAVSGRTEEAVKIIFDYVSVSKYCNGLLYLFQQWLLITFTFLLPRKYSKLKINLNIYIYKGSKKEFCIHNKAYIF
ncbi:Fatty acid synthase [Temnothorax longispinosus]|uniref:Fatty acid synthase n=1 Tax=Temnothorax longispinosus TaxID=300112 RepID=A0A4S2JHD1_9HYME|nr:Fatty acid synthase [Temnothorax longispinosus]